MHKKEPDVAILSSLLFQHFGRFLSLFNSVRATYPSPYSTNYLPIPGYPFFLYVIITFTTSIFSHANPGRFSPQGLPTASPYPLPYNANPRFPIETIGAKSSLSLNVDTSNTGKLSSIAVLPSSPVDHGNLSDYIQWHINHDPNNKRQYLSALHILRSKYYNLQTIQGWKGSKNENKWERLKIEPGIGIRLARDLSTWAKKEKSNAPTNSFSISPPSKNPMQQQRPPRISHVLEKLAKKTTLAVTEERTDSIREEEEEEDKEDFGEKDEFESADEDAGIDEEDEDVIDDNETESESDSSEEESAQHMDISQTQN